MQKARMKKHKMEKLENNAIEMLNLLCGNSGFVVSDSGGKDSSIIKHIALKTMQKYGTQFRVQHNLTTVDAPGTVYFIKAEKERFEKMRASILRFIQGFQWGIWARSYILHWKSMEEAVSAISSYLNLTNEERYAILARFSLRISYILLPDLRLYKCQDCFIHGKQELNSLT